MGYGRALFEHSRKHQEVIFKRGSEIQKLAIIVSSLAEVA